MLLGASLRVAGTFSNSANPAHSHINECSSVFLCNQSLAGPSMDVERGYCWEKGLRGGGARKPQCSSRGRFYFMRYSLCSLNTKIFYICTVSYGKNSVQNTNSKAYPRIFHMYASFSTSFCQLNVNNSTFFSSSLDHEQWFRIA